MSEYSLHLGDCLEIMPGLEAGSVDAIIADWPYGTTACAWDSVIPLDRLWPECKRVIKKNGVIVLFATDPFTSLLICSNLEWFKYKWVWDKKLAGNFLNAKKMPLMITEDICVFSSGANAYNPIMKQGQFRKKSFNGHNGNGSRIYGAVNPYETFNDIYYPVNLLEFSNASRTGLHPTQKPVALLEYLVRTYTNPGDLILDNTMGSGSTGEAALRTGRRFIGIEKDEGYFQIASKRLDNVARELRGEWKPIKDNGRLDDLPMFTGGLS